MRANSSSIERILFLPIERDSPIREGSIALSFPSINLASGKYREAPIADASGEPDVRPASSVDDRRFCGETGEVSALCAAENPLDFNGTGRKIAGGP